MSCKECTAWKGEEMNILKSMQMKLFIPVGEMETFMKTNEIHANFMTPYGEFYTKHCRSVEEGKPGLLLEKKDFYELAIILMEESDYKPDLTPGNISGVIHSLAEMARPEIETRFYEKEEENNGSGASVFEFYRENGGEKMMVLDHTRKKIIADNLLDAKLSTGIHLSEIDASCKGEGSEATVVIKEIKKSEEYTK